MFFISICIWISHFERLRGKKYLYTQEGREILLVIYFFTIICVRVIKEQYSSTSSFLSSIVSFIFSTDIFYSYVSSTLHSFFYTSFPCYLYDPRSLFLLLIFLLILSHEGDDETRSNLYKRENMYLCAFSKGNELWIFTLHQVASFISPSFKSWEKRERERERDRKSVV